MLPPGPGKTTAAACPRPILPLTIPTVSRAQCPGSPRSSGASCRTRSAECSPLSSWPSRSCCGRTSTLAIPPRTTCRHVPLPRRRPGGKTLGSSLWHEKVRLLTAGTGTGALPHPTVSYSFSGTLTPSSPDVISSSPSVAAKCLANRARTLSSGTCGGLGGLAVPGMELESARTRACACGAGGGQAGGPGAADGLSSTGPGVVPAIQEQVLAAIGSARFLWQPSWLGVDG